MSTEQAREPSESLVKCTGAFIDIHESAWHRNGTNDYSTHATNVLEIRDRHGAAYQPRWEPQTVQLCEGVETHADSRPRYVRIHREACPVRVKLLEWREYVSYDHMEHCESSQRESWLRVVAVEEGG